MSYPQIIITDANEIFMVFTFLNAQNHSWKTKSRAGIAEIKNRSLVYVIGGFYWNEHNLDFNLMWRRRQDFNLKYVSVLESLDVAISLDLNLEKSSFKRK